MNGTGYAEDVKGPMYKGLPSRQTDRNVINFIKPVLLSRSMEIECRQKFHPSSTRTNSYNQ